MTVEHYRPRFDTNRAKRDISWADKIQLYLYLDSILSGFNFFVLLGLRRISFVFFYNFIVIHSLLRLQHWHESESPYVARAGRLCEGDTTIEKI